MLNTSKILILMRVLQQISLQIITPKKQMPLSSFKWRHLVEVRDPLPSKLGLRNQFDSADLTKIVFLPKSKLLFLSIDIFECMEDCSGTEMTKDENSMNCIRLLKVRI